MPNRRISLMTAVAAGVFIALIAVTTNGVLAADECVVQPGSEPSEGGHWYYHFDRVNNRKCWYLAQPQAKVSQAETQTVQPSSDATSPPALLSFFSSLTAGFTGTNPAETQETPKHDDRATQSARSDSLKNAGLALHSDRDAALALKPAKKLPARPRGANEQTSPPLTEAERDALFKDFLKWKERQLSEAQ